MPEHTLRLLPEVIQRTVLPGSVLAALLAATDELLDPAGAVIDGVDSVFGAYRTPPAQLPYLASWLDLERYLRPGPAGVASVYPAGEAALRHLVARSATLGRSRGTAASLIGTLEVACGITGFSLQENITAQGAARPFHLLVSAPARAAVLAELVLQVVVTEKPAYLTCEVVYAGPASDEAAVISPALADTGAVFYPDASDGSAQSGGST